jgi:hypothetical protein
MSPFFKHAGSSVAPRISMVVSIRCDTKAVYGIRRARSPASSSNSKPLLIIGLKVREQGSAL